MFNFAISCLFVKHLGVLRVTLCDASDQPKLAMDSPTYNLITHLLLFRPTEAQFPLTLLQDQNHMLLSTLKQSLLLNRLHTAHPPHKASDIPYVAQLFVPETPLS